MLTTTPMDEQTGAGPADDGNRANASMQMGQEKPVRQHGGHDFVLSQKLRWSRIQEEAGAGKEDWAIQSLVLLELRQQLL